MPKPFRTVQMTARALGSVLLAHEIAQIMMHPETAEPWYNFKQAGGLILRRSYQELQARSACIQAVHIHELSDFGLSVRRRSSLIRARTEPLGIMTPCWAEELPVVMCSGGRTPAENDERSILRQAVLLVTGAERVIQSHLEFGISQIHQLSVTSHAPDAHIQKLILGALGAFWKRKLPRTALTLLSESARAKKVVRLRSKGAGVTVASWQHARGNARRWAKTADDLEIDVLSLLKGAHRGVLPDGSAITVTDVHRDAYYVRSTDYQQLKYEPK